MAEEEEYTDDEELDYTEEDTASEASADSEDGEPPWGASITVNGTTYATSLFWQPLQDTGDPLPEVLETTETMMTGADLFCVRKGTSPQFGIGNSSEGHRPGMPSAAAAIADIFQDKSSSVAVFEVDEGWWFIAVRNDLILTEEDVLYLNEEDAKRSFMSMMAVPDWGRKIAPEGWHVDGTEEIALADILKPAGAKLTRIDKNRKAKMKAMIGGAILLIAIIGYRLFYSFFLAPPKPVARRTPLRPLPVQQEEAPVQKVVEIKPWEKLVVTEDFVNRCYAGAMFLKTMVVPGWKIGDITCTSSGISTNWHMEWGHLGILKRAFQEYGTEGFDFMLSDEGSGAIVTLNVGTFDVHSEQPKYTVYEAREELTNIFQATQQEINLTAETFTQQIPNPADPSQPIVRLYNKLTFRFFSDMPIFEWLPLFKQFPALELTKLTYGPNNNTWKYEGQIYEPTL